MHAIFHVDVFLNLFGLDPQSSHTIKPLLDDVAVNNGEAQNKSTASFGGYGTQLSGARKPDPQRLESFKFWSDSNLVDILQELWDDA